MRIIDSHFHWYPRSFMEKLCRRKGFPHAEADGEGGYHIWRQPKGTQHHLHVWETWFDIDRMLERMDKLEYDVAVINSIGPFSLHFSDLPSQEGRDAALEWNEACAEVQHRYPDRFRSTGAVPLTDARHAIEVMDDAVNRLRFVGINLPTSIGNDPAIEAERLQPFYAHAAELGTTLALHPTDAVFAEILDGFDGALHGSVGRIVEGTVAVMRLILSGTMERNPDLKIFMSHMGAVLPYQAGRMDKSGGRNRRRWNGPGSRGVELSELPSTYIKRLYTDTVQPHTIGMRHGIEYFGAEHVLYGSDYPCWDPDPCLRHFDEVGLPEAVRTKILYENAVRVFGLDGAMTKAVERTRTPATAATE